MQNDPLKVIEPPKPTPKLPKWFRRSLPKRGEFFQTETILRKYQMNTVCEEAKCPNRFSCYSKKTATFLALGKSCTRSCAFCDIDFSKNPLPLSKEEPALIANSTKELGLKHVVLTMVARDDLPDGGALQLAAIMKEVRKVNPKITIEILTSDFSGNTDSLATVLEEKPEIFNHNIETVQRLSPKIRHKATYRRSLALLQQAREMHLATFIKSGFMLGLGETKEEVFHSLIDLKKTGVDIVTIGQYSQASSRKIRVKEFLPPSVFAMYKEYALRLGFLHVYAAPFVRSSLNAEEVYLYLSKRK